MGFLARVPGSISTSATSFKVRVTKKNPARETKCSFFPFTIVMVRTTSTFDSKTLGRIKTLCQALKTDRNALLNRIIPEYLVWLAGKPRLAPSLRVEYQPQTCYYLKTDIELTDDNYLQIHLARASQRKSVSHLLATAVEWYFHRFLETPEKKIRSIAHLVGKQNLAAWLPGDTNIYATDLDLYPGRTARISLLARAFRAPPEKKAS